MEGIYDYIIKVDVLVDMSLQALEWRIKTRQTKIKKT